MNLNNIISLGEAFSRLQDIALKCGIQGLQKATQTGGLHVVFERAASVSATVSVTDADYDRVVQHGLHALVAKLEVKVSAYAFGPTSPAVAVAQAQLHAEAAQFGCLLQAITADWTVGSITEGERGR